MKFGFSSVLGIASALLSISSDAQTVVGAEARGLTLEEDVALEDIVVTAERRSEDVQKIANSVSVRSGSDLLDQGKYSLKSILEDVPGIGGGAAEKTAVSEASGTDAQAAGLIIRGIPSNGGPGGSITSVATAAAIYVDGVYEGVGGGYDIDRVEVLRGPQGTLYGRSAASGVVAIHTRNPDLSKFGGDVVLEAGNYSLLHYGGALNAPLVTDTLAVRVAANRYERDGYYTREGAAFSNTDAKIKVLYQPFDALSILVGFAMQDNTTHSGGLTIGLTGPDSYNFVYDDYITPGENKYRQYWAEVNWDIGFGTLTYLPALRTWESHALQVLRGGPAAVDQLADTPKDDFWTHELRLASKVDSVLKWQVGALYYNNELESHSAGYTSPPGYPTGPLQFDSYTNRKTTALGVFGEATYPFNDSWRLTAGARYDYTKVVTAQDYFAGATGQRLPLTADEGTRKFNNFTYKLRVEHDLTPDNLVYASVSTGFSPGDVVVTTGLSGGPEVIELHDQTLTAFEIGSKNRFLDDTLQINASAYFYDYGGYQTAAIALESPFSPILGTVAPRFAALTTPMEVYGAEFELLYRLTPRDRLGFDLAYTHSRYVDKDSVPAGSSGKTFADYVARDEVPGVVPVKVDLSYTHIFDLPGGSHLSVRADARYLSAHDEGRITPTEMAAGYLPYVQVGDEVVGNLSATWSANERISLTGYVRNVGDTRYKVNPSILSVETAAGVTTYLPSTSLSDPRTYGAVLKVSF